MNLETYLFENKILKKDFAARLDIHPHHLKRVLLGTSCSRSLAIKIEEITLGKVSRFSVKPELRRKVKKKRNKSQKYVQMDAFE